MFFLKVFQNLFFQPYRTTPLVTPAPRTINDVTANRVCSSPVPFKPAPFHQSNNHVRNLKVVQSKIIEQQSWASEGGVLDPYPF